MTEEDTMWLTILMAPTKLLPLPKRRGYDPTSADDLDALSAERKRWSPRYMVPPNGGELWCMPKFVP